LPTINALATQTLNTFFYAFYNGDEGEGSAAIAIDTFVAIGAATILCEVQAAVALRLAG